MVISALDLAFTVPDARTTQTWDFQLFGMNVKVRLICGLHKAGAEYRLDGDINLSTTAAVPSARMDASELG